MKRQNANLKGNRALLIAGICSVVFLLLVTVGSMILFRRIMDQAAEFDSGQDHNSYEAYYAFISSDNSSAYWQSVYESARRAGEESGVYVDLFGSRLSTDYSAADLLRIAAASGVDGIILEADDSYSMTMRLQEAEEKGIPVVTVMGDNSQGIRKSFVGVSNYNLGREYGRQVLLIDDKEIRRVLVLMNADVQDAGRNILFTGISEIIEENRSDIQVSAAPVESQGAFATEESIRDIFLDEETLPDVIICLDELATTCTYQAVVDYNLVGQVEIIGNYDSETILRGIERNVVRATISIDTQEMGAYCVAALNEYRQTGYVSDYYGVSTNVITARNVKEYLQEESGNEE